MPHNVQQPPFSETLLQGVQLLQTAIITRQRLDLERKNLELRTKEAGALMQAREERLRLQEEALELRRQVMEFKLTAGTDLSPSAVATMRRTALDQIERNAATTLAGQLPPELKSYANKGIKDIDDALTETRRLLAGRSDANNLFMEELAQRQGKPGPLTAMQRLVDEQRKYKDLLSAAINEGVNRHPLRTILVGESQTPEGEAQRVALTAQVQSPTKAPNRTDLDSVLQQESAGGFKAPDRLREAVGAYASDLIRAGRRSELGDLYALLKSRGVPVDLQRQLTADIARIK